MMPSHLARQLAAVLVVVFVLVAVWGAFGVYAEVHPPGTTSAGTTLATYTQDSTGVFAASLRPSYLYNNTTEVFGGNVTLFTPITNWINVTIVTSVATNRSASLSLQETFTVRLSTPVWSKLLFSSANASAAPRGTMAVLVTRFQINVSQVVALANAIDNQLNYPSPSFTLSLDPLFSGSLVVPGGEQSVGFEPVVNFTFATSLITPSGLVYSSGGSIVAPTSSSDTTGFAAALPYLLLVGGLIGLGFCAWVASRREPEPPLPPLDRLIHPYEEAIASTGTVPRSAAAVEVAAFSDLVKIADTLGKPILRPSGDDATQPKLYVLDGETVYRYTYRGARGPGTDRDHRALLEPSGRIRVPSPNAGRLILQLRQEIIRLKGLSLDDRTSLEATHLARKAGDLLNLGYEDDAEKEITELARLLSRAVEVSTSRPKN